jgi:hypothetical protein
MVDTNKESASYGKGKRGLTSNEGFDPHGPDSNLIGAAGLVRKLGPETPELRLIVDELKRPQGDRDTKRLKILVSLVLRNLEQKGLKELVPLVDSPRSFVDLVLGEYDSAVRFLPSDILPGLFELFRPQRSTEVKLRRKPGRPGTKPTTLMVQHYLENHPEFKLDERIDECRKDRDALSIVGSELCNKALEDADEVVSPGRLKAVLSYVRDRKRSRARKKTNSC